MTAMPTTTLIHPDREFRRRLIASGGEDLKRCFQCATCSIVCELSTTAQPFPRKEMLYAQWGLKAKLLSDVDIWLCHGCNDCSSRCPRGARPGEVLAAIRREAILRYNFPCWLGDWIDRPRALPVLLLAPSLLLYLMAWAHGAFSRLLAAPSATSRIVIPFWSQLPQWLLIAFFSPFVVFDVVVITLGVLRFWRDLKAGEQIPGLTENHRAPRKSLPASIRAALLEVLLHQDFDLCTTNRSRANSHRFVLFGFIGLAVVDLWVLSLRFNPLLKDVFLYPFNFWSPWKILANLAGAAMLTGCALMIRDRMERSRAGTMFDGTWFDWMFLALALSALLTGFACELLHYARVDPLRYGLYVIHLSTVFVLLISLPYSKFAHAIYRTTALVYAEHTRRQRQGVSNECE